MIPSLFVTLQPLILASGSPRRREMLAGLGLDFQVIPPVGVEEVPLVGETATTFATRLATEKAVAVGSIQPAHWIIAADTVVTLDEIIFGKPENPAAALTMLRQLNGRQHQVITGFCLFHQTTGQQFVDYQSTAVTFAQVAETLLAAYVATGEPLDKAGSYGLQGLGGSLITALSGSYTSVIGLPLNEVVNGLLNHQVIRPATVIEVEA